MPVLLRFIMQLRIAAHVHHNTRLQHARSIGNSFPRRIMSRLRSGAKGRDGAGPEAAVRTVWRDHQPQCAADAARPGAQCGWGLRLFDGQEMMPVHSEQQLSCCSGIAVNELLQAAQLQDSRQSSILLT